MVDHVPLRELAENISSTSQRALQTLSNSRIPVNQCSPYGVLDTSYKKTPTGSVFPPNGGLNSSATRTCPLSRRQLSKSHGDLSHLRPKSPPLYSMAGDGHCANISPGQYAEDRRDCCPPSYGRQSRQEIRSGSEAGPPGYTPSIYKNSTGYAGHLPEAQVKEITPSAIRIEGLTPPLLQPLDFCTPYVRSHPNYLNQDKESGYGPNVEHLDVSTTWNGLQWEEAEEFLRIHQAFIVTLEHMLARELWRIYRQSYYEASGAIGILHPLYTTGVLRGISFCRNQLVSEMADALYSSEHDMARARMGLFSLYLAANECLVKYNMDDSRDTSITLRVYCDPSSSTPSPIVEAAWVPDTIRFENLSESLYEGEELSIVPRYQSNAAFGAACSAKNVRYIVSSAHHQLSWLNWNDEIAGFKGIVPIFSEMAQNNEQTESQRSDFVPTFPGRPLPTNEKHSDNVVRIDNRNPYTAVNRLQIEVKAIFVDDNSSVVRYERVVRARITFKIIPYHGIHGRARSPREVSIPSRGYKYTESAAGYMPLDILNAEYPSRHDKISQALIPPIPSTQPIDRLAAELFAAPCSVTKPFIDATRISNLAQKHADLAAEYRDLAQRHADAAKQVGLLSGPSGFGRARELDLHIHSARGTRYPEHSRSEGSSLIRSHDSAYSTRQVVGSSPPIHCPNDQVLEHTAQFSSLPPPAHLIPSQEFDQPTQTWNRVRTPGGTVINRTQISVTPAREIYNGTNDSISERGSRKRRARSSFSRSSQATPSKRARDDGINATQALMESTMITAEDDESMVGGSHVDPVYNPESTEALANISRASSDIPADTHSVPRSTSNGMEIVVEKDPQERKTSRKQQAALWASSSSLGSQAAKQGTESTQSPEARVGGRSSASPRRSLAESRQTRVSSQRYCGQNNAGPQSEFNDKLNGTPAKFEEPKLSRDEQQALDEAIARSFDDIMGKFEDVFLDEDAGFSSSTDSGDHDEQVPEGEDV